MTDSSKRSLDELLTRARPGNSYLGQLLEAHQGYLTMLARVRMRGWLQGKVNASDLVQETFLAAHEHFDSFLGKTEAEFLAWLRRILVSRISAAIRRFVDAKRRDTHLEQQLENDLERTSRFAHNLAVSQTSPSEGAILRERAVLLADALETLPSHYREVILLREFEGLSYPEIAQHIGRSPEAVRKLWIRGLAELHKLLVEKLSDTT